MVPNEGEIKLLEYMLNVTEADDPVLKLYQNNVTLSDTTILADFTECSDSSYAAVTLTNSGWVIAVDTDRALATYSEIIFTFAGEQNVWGYFVTNNAGTSLLWAQQANCAPTILPEEGGTFVVRPKFYTRQSTSS